MGFYRPNIMTSLLLRELYSRTLIFGVSSSQLSLMVALPSFHNSNDDGAKNNFLKVMTHLQGLTCY